MVAGDLANTRGSGSPSPRAAGSNGSPCGSTAGSSIKSSILVLGGGAGMILAGCVSSGHARHGSSSGSSTRLTGCFSGSTHAVGRAASA